jgi:hypothetical protein
MATDRPPEALAWYEDPRHLPYLYAISGFALMGFLAWFLHSPGLVFVGFAFTGFGWMSDKDKTKAQGPVSLPVAYSRDLRPYLTDKAAHPRREPHRGEPARRGPLRRGRR